MTEINVPPNEIRPGDIVRFNDARIEKGLNGPCVCFSTGKARLMSIDELLSHGAFFVREMEPEFNLTWGQAVVAMFRGNGSVVCEDGSLRTQYRIHQGQLQALLRGEWSDIVGVHESFFNAKYRIACEELVSNVGHDTVDEPPPPVYDLRGESAFMAIVMDGKTVERCINARNPQETQYLRMKWVDGSGFCFCYVPNYFSPSPEKNWYTESSWATPDQMAMWRIVEEKQNG